MIEIVGIRNIVHIEIVSIKNIVHIEHSVVSIRKFQYAGGEGRRVGMADAGWRRRVGGAGSERERERERERVSE